MKEMDKWEEEEVTAILSEYCEHIEKRKQTHANECDAITLAHTKSGLQSGSAE